MIRLLRVRSLRKLSSMRRAGPPPCIFFQRGRCWHGEACRFSHTLPAALPFHERAFVHAQEGGPHAPRDTPPPERLRVVSYNVLADHLAHEHAAELYAAVPRPVLEWAHRGALLVAEVARYAPEVLCLQEVDHFKALAAALAPHGYVGAYAQRSGGRHDGLATFWRADALDAVKVEKMEFAQLGLRDNVAQAVLLRRRQPAAAGGAAQGSPRPQPPPASAQHTYFDESNGEEAAWPASSAAAGAAAAGRAAGAQVLVGNIHVLFNPKRGDIKLAQVRALLQHLHDLGVGAGGVPTLICGDFNSAAGSAIYDFISSGELDLRGCDRRRMSGQVEGQGKGWSSVRDAFMAELRASERQAAVAGPPGGGVEEARALHAALLSVPYAPGTGPEQASPAEQDGAAASPSGQRPGTGGRGSAHHHSARVGRWTSEELATAVGRRGSGGGPPPHVARHPLRLRSAYAAVAGREPPYTTCHGRYIGTVDFVWYTPGPAGGHRLRPLRVLAPPQLAGLPGGLPSRCWPSDHVALVADFALEAQQA